jgi:hypothetical protein
MQSCVKKEKMTNKSKRIIFQCLSGIASVIACFFLGWKIFLGVLIFVFGWELADIANYYRKPESLD